jgi:uncharacterized protein YkvS
MTYNINELINYFVKHRNDVPIQETIFINSIISSLEYLKLLMDSNIKKLFVVEHPNFQILNKYN